MAKTTPEGQTEPKTKEIVELGGMLITLPPNGSLPKSTKPASHTRDHIQKAGTLRKTTYDDNPAYQLAVHRYARRKAGKRKNYFARSYGVEYGILMGWAAFHKVLQVERKNNKGITRAHLIALLICKAYLVSSGRDYLFARSLQTYTSTLLWRDYSIQSSSSICRDLEAAHYLNPLPIDKRHQTKYVLSMKARAFFRDLDEAYKLPFDPESYLHKTRL